MKKDPQKIYFAIFFLLFFSLYFYYLSTVSWRSRYYRALPAGMSLEGVKRVMGEPDHVIDSQEYKKLLKQAKVKNVETDKHPLLPVENKVFIYAANGLDYYVFFDDKDKVKMVFTGTNKIKPYWAGDDISSRWILGMFRVSS